MKDYDVTIRTDIKSKTDISFKIKAYSKDHAEDILGWYWVMEIEEIM